MPDKCNPAYANNADLTNVKICRGMESGIPLRWASRFAAIVLIEATRPYKINMMLATGSTDQADKQTASSAVNASSSAMLNRHSGAARAVELESALVAGEVLIAHSFKRSQIERFSAR